MDALSVTPPTLQERASGAAVLFDISSSTLFNLIGSESNWDADAVNGRDRGLVQINSLYHPEISDEQAFDADFAINYAAKAIRDGTQNQFVVCSCVAYVRTRVPKLPRGDASELIPNSSPRKGSVVIYNYSGTYHLSYMKDFDSRGYWEAGTNLEACKIYTRFVRWDSLEFKKVIGFWYPS